MQEAARLTSGTSLFAIWFGFLGGHVAWSVQILASYFLFVPFACATGNFIPLHLVALVAALVTVAAGLVAYSRLLGSARADLGHARRADTMDRSWTRFLALQGVLLDGLFLFLILLGGIANFVADPCRFGSALRPPV